MNYVGLDSSSHLRIRSTLKGIERIERKEEEREKEEEERRGNEAKMLPNRDRD